MINPQQQATAINQQQQMAQVEAHWKVTPIHSDVIAYRNKVMR